MANDSLGNTEWSDSLNLVQLNCNDILGRTISLFNSGSIEPYFEFINGTASVRLKCASTGSSSFIFPRNTGSNYKVLMANDSLGNTEWSDSLNLVQLNCNDILGRNIALYSSGSIEPQIQFINGTGSLTLKCGSVVSTFVFPTNGSNHNILTTDGSGNTSWTSAPIVDTLTASTSLDTNTMNSDVVRCNSITCSGTLSVGTVSASSITDSELVSNYVVGANPLSKLVSIIPSTYISNITSDIQAQVNTINTTISSLPTIVSDISNIINCTSAYTGLSASYITSTNSSKQLVSIIPSSYISSLSSDAQGQINSLSTSVSNITNGTTAFTGTVTVPNIIDNGLTASYITGTNSSKQLISIVPTGYISNLTSGVQLQLNNLINGVTHFTGGQIIPELGTGHITISNTSITGNTASSSFQFPPTTGTSGQVLTAYGTTGSTAWTKSLRVDDVEATGYISALQFNATVILTKYISISNMDDGYPASVEFTNGTGLTKLHSVANVNTTFVLPGSNGSSGNVLKTDGSGNTSWTDTITLNSITTTSLDVASFITAYQLNLDRSDTSPAIFLRFGSYSTLFTRSDSAVSTTFILPDTDGAANDVLASDGGGYTFWKTLSNCAVGAYLSSNITTTISTTATSISGLSATITLPATGNYLIRADYTLALNTLALDAVYTYASSSTPVAAGAGTGVQLLGANNVLSGSGFLNDYGSGSSSATPKVFSGGSSITVSVKIYTGSTTFSMSILQGRANSAGLYAVNTHLTLSCVPA
jgi:hypothetical protein